MRSFKEYVAERDETNEGMWGDFANGLRYRLDYMGATQQQRAQANAVDTFGNTYQKVSGPLNQSAQNMNNLRVPAADELQDKVAGVGRKFDKVVRKSKTNQIPVRNFGGFST